MTLKEQVQKIIDDKKLLLFDGNRNHFLMSDNDFIEISFYNLKRLKLKYLSDIILSVKAYFNNRYSFDIANDMIMELPNILQQKNDAYGNSFTNAYNFFDKDENVIRVRVYDKISRLDNLTKNKNINQGDESIKDTLIDLLGYLLLIEVNFGNVE